MVKTGNSDALPRFTLSKLSGVDQCTLMPALKYVFPQVRSCPPGAREEIGDRTAGKAAANDDDISDDMMSERADAFLTPSIGGTALICPPLVPCSISHFDRPRSCDHSNPEPRMP